MHARRKLDDNSFEKCRIGALSVLFISAVFLSLPVHAQESQMVTITGVLNSLTRNTMVVRAEDGLYRLYTFDRNTTNRRQSRLVPKYGCCRILAATPVFA